MIKEGRVFKYGDNVDTDVIIPARYLSTSKEEELAKYAMIDIDEKFASEVKYGDIMIAGENFGCGSSREHAPIAIKGSGISCIIAKSFARIFYRNSFNIGLPILESKDAVDESEKGDKIKVDLKSGLIINLTKNKEYKSQPIPDFMQEIIRFKGLVNYTNEKIKGENDGI